MSQDDLFGAPAGWYPDPLGLPQLRWWNNHAWTEQTSAARQPIVMQDTKFAWADDELPSRREERAHERSADESEIVTPERPSAETLRQLDPPRSFVAAQETSAAATAPVAAAAATAPPVSTPVASAPVAPVASTVAPEVAAEKSWYQPDPILDAPVTLSPAVAMQPSTESLDALFGQRESRLTATKPKTPIAAADAIASTATKKVGPANNGPSWIIAVIPLIQLVMSLLLMNFGLGGVPAIFVGILVAPYFIVIGLAAIDERSLRNAGFDNAANWKWSILSAPVYLLMRARSVIAASGHGMGPVLAWFGLAVLHIASVLAIPGLVISVVPSLFTPQIEQSIASDARLISGADLSVTCAAPPPVLIGQQMTCSSVSADGNSTTITVQLVRSNGWIAWQVTDWGAVTMAQ